ncbi:MAG: class I SAM-dependent methyltransferase [Thermoanaerobaculia bacterium]
MKVEERWGSASFTHTLAEIGWMASLPVLMHLNERATGDPARDWLSAWARRYFIGTNLRVLVLGCGEGWLERAIASWPFVARIDAVDIAAEAVGRAREAAAALGITKIHYDVVDLNHDSLSADSYDVIVAHSILHHVENLERAFDQIERALRHEGVLLVNEYVGPKRFQFSDEVLSIVNELLACFPESLRRSALSGNTYQRKERPSEAEMIANDPSEAVRSDELRIMLAERFTILDQRELGGTLLQHLLYDIVQNFRSADPRERAMVELLCALEGALVDCGAIPSDFAMVAARRRAATMPIHKYDRQLIPRPPEARDVDADPLGFGKCQSRGSRSEGKRALTTFQLRMLRIALSSVRTHRRNLIAESRWRTTLEQMRFRRAGVSGFDWIAARWSAVSDPGLESDRAIGKLLSTMARIGADRLPGP